MNFKEGRNLLKIKPVNTLELRSDSKTSFSLKVQAPISNQELTAKLLCSHEHA